MAAILTLTFSVLAYAALAAPVQASAAPEGFNLVAENESLRLYIHPGTAEIAIEEIASHTLWFSNPADRKTEERIARGQTKDQLSAQFTISYYTPAGEQRLMDSYNESIKFAQYEIIPLDNGVRVRYDLGKRWKDTDYLPVMIRADRFESLILEEIDSSKDRKFVRDSYYLIALEPLGPDDEPMPDLYGLNAKQLFGDYKLVPKQDMSSRTVETLPRLLADQIVGHRKDMSQRSHVQFRDIEQLTAPTYILRNDLMSWDYDDLVKILKEIGYTPEQATADHEENHLDPPIPNVQTFSVTIEYTLDGNDLVVRVPVDEIVYPDSVVNELGRRVTYPIYTIRLLEYFGAAGMSEEGYIFVPDGSGALINLNSNRLYAAPFSIPVYGRDNAVAPTTERVRYTSQAYLPVFGIKAADRAFLAIIEDGESLASIRADIAGRTNSYNTVHSEFVLLPRAVTTLQGRVDVVVAWQAWQDSINIFQSRLPSCDIVVRYAFLHDDQANYVGMAHYYQDYLVNKHGLRQDTAREHIPFYLGLVGAIERRKPVLGIPRTVIEPLTTFDEAITLLKNAVERGLESIELVFSGWLSGGINHRFPVGVNVERALGGLNGFLALADYAKSAGIGFSPEVGFINVYPTGWFDGFSPTAHASRFLNRRTAKVSGHNPATMQTGYDTSAYVLSPAVLPSVVERFIGAYTKHGVSGITLKDMGTEVNSDFREDKDKLVDRQQARNVIAGQLEVIRSALGKDVGPAVDTAIDPTVGTAAGSVAGSAVGTAAGSAAGPAMSSAAGTAVGPAPGNVVIDGGNAFTLPYVDSIVNAPLWDSGFKITDESVPFYQIVVHGFVDYAGEPINLAQDTRTAKLRSIETGAYPYYKLYFADASKVKGTDYDWLYAANFAEWIEDAVGFYREADAVLGRFHGQRIVNHEKLAAGVYRTTYEDGGSVIVNYNEEPYVHGSVTVSGGMTVSAELRIG